MLSKIIILNLNFVTGSSGRPGGQAGRAEQEVQGGRAIPEPAQCAVESRRRRPARHTLFALHSLLPVIRSRIIIIFPPSGRFCPLLVHSEPNSFITHIVTIDQ